MSKALVIGIVGVGALVGLVVAANASSKGPPVRVTARSGAVYDVRNVGPGLWEVSDISGPVVTYRQTGDDTSSRVFVKGDNRSPQRLEIAIADFGVQR